ncbi:Sec-independent protein translocase protein TatA/B/E [Macleaya cordata]|uniref:Sec-independent protein translocase protein TatA/B/E n=1 Tax=Macleaya cordata TaxID=56857 RepID=A0A200QU70_MACCD|nr:Sec-independent protein translocase protein TatA/B/E [Macleaya cordata]
MASTISTPTFLCSSAHNRSTTFTISSSLVLYPNTPKSRISTSIPQLSLTSISPWNGLRHMGISIRPKSVKTGRRGKCRGKVVYASLFGVGAPEALVIGVVALLVFGPKGLAEVARNLGKTLRAFQPTIRELQEVSREFKSTLEREIGLDDIPPSAQNTYSSTTPTSTSSPVNADDESSQAVVDPNGAQSADGSPPTDGTPPEDAPANIGEFLVKAHLKASAAQQQKEATPEEDQSESQPQPQATDTAPEVVATMPPLEKVESEKEISLPVEKKETEISSSTN